MTRRALACLALLGSALAARADGPVAETVPAPGIGWVFAKKTVVPEGPVAPPVAETARGTKDPNSFVHGTTEEFFARPVVFNQPTEPVKTTQWFWVSGEYLHWWTKTASQPVPLVTSGATPGDVIIPNPLFDPDLPVGPGNLEFLSISPMVITAPNAGGGILGQPGTGILFGGDGLNYGAFSGARLSGGFWFGDQCEYEASLSAFTLGQRSVQFDANSGSNGAPVIARPFFNAEAGAESVLLVSAPGLFEGSIGISSTSQLSGFEGNLGMLVSQDGALTWQVQAGFRYLYLDEDITATQRTQELDDGQAFFDGQPIAKSETLVIFDSFSTTNQFLGGQLGTSAAYRYGSLVVEGRGKVAIGANRTQFATLGITGLEKTIIEEAELGGFLAQPSNIGEESRNNFSIATELGCDIACVVSSYCILKVGYTFLYWTDVTQPGTMIDRVISANQIPVSITYQSDGGSARPLPRFDRSDFWAQGLSAGIEFRY